MDFHKKDNYTIEDIQALIDNRAEEGVHLELKRADALNREKADKITKSFSAFANSDGGVVIYGVAEKDHVASEYSFIDGNKVTKEQIAIIARSVQPTIQGLQIFPIRKDGDFTKSIYVVQIPRSDKAPHMAKDHRYYKRNNVESLPMEDYDVKDVMSRVRNPKLGLVGCFITRNPVVCEGSESVKFSFMSMIDNYGRVLSREYKIVSYFFCEDETLSPKYNPVMPLLTKSKTLVIGDMFCTKISTPSQEAIFPNEKLEFGHVEIEVDKNEVDAFFNKAFVVSTLFWEGGGREDLLSFLNGDEQIYDRVEIAKHIPEHLRQLILGQDYNKTIE
jgi:hypothetical protein